MQASGLSASVAQHDGPLLIRCCASFDARGAGHLDTGAVRSQLRSAEEDRPQPLCQLGVKKCQATRHADLCTGIDLLPQLRTFLAQDYQQEKYPGIIPLVAIAFHT